jgi:hypothetical protein
MSDTLVDRIQDTIHDITHYFSPRHTLTALATAGLLATTPTDADAQTTPPDTTEQSNTVYVTRDTTDQSLDADTVVALDTLVVEEDHIDIHAEAANEMSHGHVEHELLAQPFIMSGIPGVSNVIYRDFFGQTGNTTGPFIRTSKMTGVRSFTGRRWPHNATYTIEEANVTNLAGDVGIHETREVDDGTYLTVHPVYVKLGTGITTSSTAIGINGQGHSTRAYHALNDELDAYPNFGHVDVQLTQQTPIGTITTVNGVGQELTSFDNLFDIKAYSGEQRQTYTLNTFTTNGAQAFFGRQRDTNTERTVYTSDTLTTNEDVELITTGVRYLHDHFTTKLARHWLSRNGEDQKNATITALTNHVDVDTSGVTVSGGVRMAFTHEPLTSVNLLLGKDIGDITVTGGAGHLESIIQTSTPGELVSSQLPDGEIDPSINRYAFLRAELDSDDLPQITAEYMRKHFETSFRGFPITSHGSIQRVAVNDTYQLHEGVLGVKTEFTMRHLPFNLAGKKHEKTPAAAPIEARVNLAYSTKHHTFQLNGQYRHEPTFAVNHQIAELGDQVFATFAYAYTKRDTKLFGVSLDRFTMAASVINWPDLFLQNNAFATEGQSIPSQGRYYRNDNGTIERLERYEINKIANQPILGFSITLEK